MRTVTRQRAAPPPPPPPQQQQQQQQHQQQQAEVVAAASLPEIDHTLEEHLGDDEYLQEALKALRCSNRSFEATATRHVWFSSSLPLLGLKFGLWLQLYIAKVVSLTVSGIQTPFVVMMLETLAAAAADRGTPLQLRHLNLLDLPIAPVAWLWRLVLLLQRLPNLEHLQLRFNSSIGVVDWWEYAFERQQPLVGDRLCGPVECGCCSRPVFPDSLKSLVVDGPASMLHVLQLVAGLTTSHANTPLGRLLDEQGLLLENHLGSSEQQRIWMYRQVEQLVPQLQGHQLPLVLPTTGLQVFTWSPYWPFGTPFTAHDLQLVQPQQWRALQQLHLDVTGVVPLAVQAAELAQLPVLQQLRAGGIEFSDADQAALRQHVGQLQPKLVEMGVRHGVSLLPQTFDLLPQGPNVKLQTLDLRGLLASPAAAKGVVIALGAHLTQLSVAVNGRHPRHRDQKDLLLAISSLRNLKALRLVVEGVGGLTERDLSFLSQATGLTQLEVEWQAPSSNRMAACAAAVQQLPQLRVLSVPLDMVVVGAKGWLTALTELEVLELCPTPDYPGCADPAAEETQKRLKEELSALAQATRPEPAPPAPPAAGLAPAPGSAAAAAADQADAGLKLVLFSRWHPDYWAELDRFGGLLKLLQLPSNPLEPPYVTALPGDVEVRQGIRLRQLAACGQDSFCTGQLRDLVKLLEK